MKRKIVAIGEALIDFIPNEKGQSIKDTLSYTKMPGGAPANVAVQAAKLGVPSYFIGQVGQDGFGDFLKEILEKESVNTTYVFQTEKAHTALAFVTLTGEGERDFAFYRNPSADQLLSKDQVEPIKLDDSIIHFCSLSLDNYPLQKALTTLLENHKDAIISFDPNLRLSLFGDLDFYRKVILDFIPYANILKVSDDELYFITHEKDEAKAIQFLFDYGINILILTRGKDGVTYIDQKRTINVPGFKVEVVDTTGAGDSWIGTFLAELSVIDDIVNLPDESLISILKKANQAAALTTTQFGAISALPSNESIKKNFK